MGSSSSTAMAASETGETPRNDERAPEGIASSPATGDEVSATPKARLAAELVRLKGLIAEARTASDPGPIAAVGYLADALDGIIALVEDRELLGAAMAPSSDGGAKTAATAADDESDSDSDPDSPLDAAGRVPWDDGDAHEKKTESLWDGIVGDATAVVCGGDAALRAAQADYDKARADLIKDGKDSEEIAAQLGARPRYELLPVEMVEKSRARLAEKAAAGVEEEVDNWTPGAYKNRFAAPVIIDSFERFARNVPSAGAPARPAAAEAAKAPSAAAEAATLTKASTSTKASTPTPKKQSKKVRGPRLDRDGFLPWDESEYHEQLADDMRTRAMLDRVDAAARYDLDAGALRAKGASGDMVEARLGRRPVVTAEEVERAAALRAGPDADIYAPGADDSVEDAPNRPPERGAAERARQAAKAEASRAREMSLDASDSPTRGRGFSESPQRIWDSDDEDDKHFQEDEEVWGSGGGAWGPGSGAY